MSIRLYVGNLPKESIEREALQEVFAEANAVVSTKVIKDRKTGKCRGFAFVTVSTDEAADEFIEKYNGQSFMDSPLKIEKANPRSKDDEEGGSETPAASGEKTKQPRTDKKRSNKKAAGASANTSTASEGFQPDPRWADQLAQLKEKLTAAQ
ncbi:MULTISPECIES: RNA recognition motif domain-containing protein [Synechocystis]|uniref:RNA-binding protein n=1 Tax=Synechocystis salina LEGE 00031 TaxID=1828736 RepID=A0ABR9VVH2_9SYNC|nr:MULTISPECIES: RNA-binding protein [Synechocystis]MBD2652750.1 RNA-binding protein [Synechocystis sp. FACHB-383]MBE9241756.1 RNA-binding protein [Synechocystis salina LEGE 00041]MBE9255041.1 RNA-binding protein [Synechocystis salina LEGE 00031]